MKHRWETKRLGEVLEVQNGYPFDSNGFNPTKGLPLVRIRSLKSGIEKQTRFDGEYDARYVVKAGDLLIGMDGEFGCYEWKGEPALLNQRVCRLQGFSRSLLPRFLLYGVNDYLKAIEDVTGFATVKHLSSKQILGIRFPIPALREQQRVVGVLDAAFAGLATAQAHAEKNLQQARALFESKLAEAVRSEGNDWGSCELDSQLIAGRRISYGIVKPGVHDPDGVRLIKSQQVRDDSMDLSEDFRITRKLDAEYARTRLQGGEILLNLVGASIGRSAIAPTELKGANVSRAIAVIPVRRDVAPWIQFCLRSSVGQALIQSKTGGSAQPVLNLSEVKALSIPIPPPEERQQIVGQLDAFAAETERLQGVYGQKLAALAALKQSLLSQAFNGAL